MLQLKEQNEGTGAFGLLLLIACAVGCVIFFPGCDTRALDVPLDVDGMVLPYLMIGSSAVALVILLALERGR